MAAPANDTYGSALAAHPGESQGRPCTNSGSRPIERSPACPNLRLLPDAPVPDGRTVLLSSPATTSSRSVGAGGIHGLSYQLPTRVDLLAGAGQNPGHQGAGQQAGRAG